MSQYSFIRQKECTSKHFSPKLKVRLLIPQLLGRHTRAHATGQAHQQSSFLSIGILYCMKMNRRHILSCSCALAIYTLCRREHSKEIWTLSRVVRSLGLIINRNQVQVNTITAHGEHSHNAAETTHKMWNKEWHNCLLPLPMTLCHNTIVSKLLTY